MTWITGVPGQIAVIGGSGGGGASGGITELTGDVTAGPGSDSQVATIAALAVTTGKIADDAVTYPKIQNVSSTDRLLGRVTAAAGNIEEIPITDFVQGLLDDVDAATFRTSIGAAGGTGTASGTNTGDQTITLTGDVIGSGTGSFAATIANNAVTMAKLADLAGLSVIGNATNGSTDPAAITAANDGEVLRRSGTALGFGTVAAAGLASDAVTTVKILNDNVTNAKLADMAAATIKGSVAGGDPADLTGTQATALLDVATTSLKGLGPARSGVSTEYLSGTGVYSTPAGGGGGGGILDTWHFQAESLDDADPAMAVTGVASFIQSPTCSAHAVRAFASAGVASTWSAVGGKLTIPTGANVLLLGWGEQASAAPNAASNNVQYRLYMYNQGSFTLLGSTDLTPHVLAANTNMQVFSQTIGISAISGMVAGSAQYYQLARISAAASTLNAPIYLSEFNIRASAV